ncbi:MAG: hypothetical protein ACT4O3_03360, partial [Elusimicrobiota bacterium]
MAAGFLALFLGAGQASAEAQRELNYQGKLTDRNGQPRSGSYDMAFAVYGAASGGVPLFSETRPAVPVLNGAFVVRIGSVTAGGIPAAALSGADRWLELMVGSEVLSPRQKLASVPFALAAASAAVGGAELADASVALTDLNLSNLNGRYLNLDTPQTLSALKTFSAGYHLSGGSLGIGTSIPAFPLDVHGAARFGGAAKSAFAASGSLDMAAGRNVTLSGGKVKGLSAPPAAADEAVSKSYVESLLSGSGGGWTDSGAVVHLASPGDAIGAAPGASGLSISTRVFITGGRLGIGSSNPSAPLDVAGRIKITGGSPGSGKILVSDAEGLGSWQALSGGEATTAGNGLQEVGDDVRLGGSLFTATDIDLAGNSLAFTGAGNVGIGTTTPGARLHVGGQIKIEGGAPAAGKILTSDADGLASWETLTGGEATTAGNGLTEVGDDLRLGGTLATNTDIASAGYNLNFTGLSGNVGVGTSTPDARLHVGGQIKITGGGPAAGEVLTSDDNGLATWEPVPPGAGEATSPGNGLSLSGTELRLGGTLMQGTTINMGFIDFIYSGAGNVGIGTNAPDAKLHVGGQVKITGGLPGAGKILSTDAAGLARWISLSSVDPTFAENGLEMAGPQVRLGGALTGDTDIALAGENLTFSGAGNLGIGTTAPDAKLHVAGRVKITGGSPAAGRALTSDAAGLASWTDLTITEQTEPGSGLAEVGDVLRLGGALDADTNIAMGTHTFSLSGLGNVGVGTGTPNARLHVEGSVKIVDGNQAAGRLFESDASGLGSWVDPASVEQTSASNGLTRTRSNILILGGTLTQNTGIAFAGNPLSFLPTTGRLGIGTASPAARLDVAGNIAVTGTVDGVDVGAKAANWNSAASERRQWDGGNLNLSTTVARASLGLGDLAYATAISNDRISNDTVANFDF